MDVFFYVGAAADTDSVPDEFVKWDESGRSSNNPPRNELVALMDRIEDEMGRLWLRPEEVFEDGELRGNAADNGLFVIFHDTAAGLSVAHAAVERFAPEVGVQCYDPAGMGPVEVPTEAYGEEPPRPPGMP